DADPGGDPRPQNDRRGGREADHQPHDRLQRASLGRPADDGHQKGRGDDVAEAEQSVGHDEHGRTGGAARTRRRRRRRRFGASGMTTPLASQSARHGWPQAVSAETRTAAITMPVPTPAKCTADSSGRPAAPSRSSTSAEANTSTNAVATPPRKRRARNIAFEETKAMAPVVTALAASPARSQRRRDPITMGE